MRAFGILFTSVGSGLAALSARAISDPQNPIGWDRLTDDPWYRGLQLGTIVAVFGVVLLIARRRVSPDAERRMTRALATVVAAAFGFILLAPIGATTMCSDGIGGGGCRTVDWATITGLSFSGPPNFAIALVTATTLGVCTWLLVGRSQGRSDRSDLGSHANRS